MYRELIEGILEAHRRGVEGPLMGQKRPQCSRTAALSESKHRLHHGYKHKLFDELMRHQHVLGVERFVELFFGHQLFFEHDVVDRAVGF